MNLRKKLATAITVAVAITIIIYTISTIAINQSRMNEELQFNTQSTEQRLGVTLASAMWNYDTDAAQKISAAELGTNGLVGVVGYNTEGKILFEVSWNSDTQKPEAKPYTQEEYLKTSKDILFTAQGENIQTGSVELFFDDAGLSVAFYQSIVNGIVQLILLTVCLVAVISAMSNRLVVSPIDTINTRVKEIAEGDGDLTKRVEYQSNDELGELSRNINDFINHVHNIVQEVIEVSVQLDKTTHDSQGNVNQLNDQVNILNTRVNDIQTAISALGEISEHVAKQANTSMESTRNTTELARDGMKNVNNAARMIRELETSIKQSTSKTEALESHSQSITTVIEVIRGIADQTNLLALNAAIEAARAGEQGRGFAVVADEVRTLAQRTQVSTGEIAEIIEQLQSQSSSTLDVMKHGLSLVEKNVESVEKAERTFELIHDAISVNLEGSKEIASDVDRQQQMLAEIQNNISEILRSNKQTLAIAEENSSINTYVIIMSESVSKLIEKFKVEKPSDKLENKPSKTNINEDDVLFFEE
jgi:methyl-accepting chemotaxis protein